MNNSLKKVVHLFLAILTLAVVATWLTGCAEDEKNEPATIQLKEHANFGSILTDVSGKTLYFYSRDSKGDASACTGGCLNKWPIYNVEKLVVPPGLKAEDFGTIGDGATKQVTYKGWPLYYYAPDGAIEATGEVGGDAVGGVWFVAKPDYVIMIANAQLVGADGKSYVTPSYAEGTGTSFYFTSDAGYTLYSYYKDTKDKNNFTSSGLTNNATWPIFYSESSKFPTGVNPADFGTITITGSTAKQLTYKGWPLYYYGDEGSRGNNKGVSVPTPGKWPIVNTTISAAPLN
jgi:predicted lipoprotein with Yx(FWY)xxD motif